MTEVLRQLPHLHMLRGSLHALHTRINLQGKGHGSRELDFVVGCRLPRQRPFEEARLHASDRAAHDRQLPWESSGDLHFACALLLQSFGELGPQPPDQPRVAGAKAREKELHAEGVLRG